MKRCFKRWVIVQSWPDLAKCCSRVILDSPGFRNQGKGAEDRNLWEPLIWTELNILHYTVFVFSGSQTLPAVSRSRRLQQLGKKIPHSSTKHFLVRPGSQRSSGSGVNVSGITSCPEATAPARVSPKHNGEEDGHDTMQEILQEYYPAGDTQQHKTQAGQEPINLDPTDTLWLPVETLQQHHRHTKANKISLSTII